MPEGQKHWHLQVVDEQTTRTLHDLSQTSMLDKFYLAGGTGLALQLGHRRSRDLDFFTSEPFNADGAIDKLRGLAALRVMMKGEGTLHAHIAGTKVSFLHYAYPLLFPTELCLGARIADPRDIACMKISAIASRGTRRDFIDLYAVAQVHGLKQLIEWFERKFREAHLSRIHLLKSLTFFEDARRDPMPDMLIPFSWEEVEAFFAREVPKLV